MLVPKWVWIFSAVFALLFCAYAFRSVFADEVLTISILKNGEGGAALLAATPHGRIILVDAGKDASILRALGETLPARERRIDAVILTSPSKDAAGGLPQVLERYKVPALVRSGMPGSKTIESAIASALKPGIRLIEVRRGERLSLGDGLYADVLWPAKGAEDVLLMRLSYGTTSFLIGEGIQPRAREWLETLNKEALEADASINSKTPFGVFVSDGARVRFEPR